MLADFLIPFVAIALAELGDKTQLCILFFSSKTKRHVMLLAGVMLAFFVVDGVAIIAGSWVTSVVPQGILKLVSGSIFIVFGILMLLEKSVFQPEKMKSRNPLAAGFMLIFISEWGDKTQIASGLLATKYDWFFVLAGTLTALLLLSAMAIFLGKFITDKIHPKTVAKIAGAAFVLIGISFVVL
jgi:putative Ca2+/H+ antiporter (TMEM165/GDT1 family)